MGTATDFTLPLTDTGFYPATLGAVILWLVVVLVIGMAAVEIYSVLTHK